MMPIVAPSRSPATTRSRCPQRPSRTRSVNGPSRLTRCSAIARTPSATARVPLPGVITTGIPLALAAARSIRSTPTPVRASTRSAGARSRKSASTTASARAMAPTATARSASVGSATNEMPAPRTPVTSAGSTEPRATTTGRFTPMTRSLLPVAERRAGNRRHPLPRAAVGGSRGGRDHLGHVVRIVDGGVAALAAGHRDEELLRLDDLEVVVPHAVTGAGLEMRVVAQVSVAQHRGVAVVGTTATDADPQLVQLLEVPGRRAVGSVDL